VAGAAGFPDLRPGTPPYDGELDGEPVRVTAVSVDTPAGRRELGVARTVRQRLEVKAAIVRSLVVLVSLGTLALAGVVWLSVGNALRPLAHIRAGLAAREQGDLAPIPLAAVPYEVAPVVNGFNELLDKVDAGARAQRDFLADMAHQLRTPLAGMQLQLEWLHGRHAADPETRGSLALMAQANERMIRQVNQLLSLARAREGQLGAELAPLDLALLVEEAIQFFVQKAARKNIDLGFELRLAPVNGDAFQLRDLIDNLIDNALRYTPDGGQVTVRCGRKRGGASALIIEDSGPGIPPARRRAVFERFVRLDDKTVGSGLGLAIVRDIARVHGARLALDDAAGGGTRIAVRFPATSTSPASA
jgi:two-component system sensor histidine kinase TctE